MFVQKEFKGFSQNDEELNQLLTSLCYDLQTAGQALGSTINTEVLTSCLADEEETDAHDANGILSDKFIPKGGLVAPYYTNPVKVSERVNKIKTYMQRNNISVANEKVLKPSLEIAIAESDQGGLE